MVRIGHKRYFFESVEIKHYHVIADGKNIFDQSVKDVIRNDNIQNITTSQGDD